MDTEIFGPGLYDDKTSQETKLHYYSPIIEPALAFLEQPMNSE